MTPKEAYEIVKERFGDDQKVISCKKYINGYGFILAPKDANDREKIFVGGQRVCVSENGKIQLVGVMDKQPMTIEEIDVSIFGR